MSNTSTIIKVCQIAEDYGREIGLASFDFESIVHSKDDGKDEWICFVQFGELDPLIEDDGDGAIIVVDGVSYQPRLFEKL